MSTATTRETPGSGIVMPIELVRHLHRDLVVRDEQELRFAPTSPAPSGRSGACSDSSSGASTSSSRQNGAGLSWNSANTSEIAVSAFSPPDSRWIDVLRLPGGCAITCTPESRISSPVSTSFAWPPPNSVGKSFAKFVVDDVERLLQQLARFAVDLADRRSRASSSPRSDRRPGGRDTPCARSPASSSSSAARLTAPSSAIALGETLDFGGQRARAAPRLERVGQRGEIGLRFGELLGELLLGERRRLLLELHLLDLRARRIELLLGGKPRLVARAQARPPALPAGCAPSASACSASPRAASCRCSASSTGVQSIDCRSLVSCASSACCCATCAASASRRRAMLREALAAAALGEARLLRRALGGAQLLAASRERDFGFVARVPRRLALRHLDRAAAIARSAISAAIAACSSLPCACCAREIVALLRDLRAPARRRFGRLAQLHELELEIVAAPLLRGERQAFRDATSPAGPCRSRSTVSSAAARGAGGARRASRSAPASSVSSRWRASTPCSSLSGAKNAMPCALTRWPSRRDERFAAARASPRAASAAARSRLAAHAVQAVGEHARDARRRSCALSRAAHRRRRARRRRRRSDAHRRRGVRAARRHRRSMSSASSRRASSSAFRRSRSTASSASSQPGSISTHLPQPPRVRETARVEPAVDVLAVADPRLQRGQRVGARGEIGEPLARRAATRPPAPRWRSCSACTAACSSCCSCCLPASSAVLLRELLLDGAHRIGGGRRERLELGRKARRAARRCCASACAALSRRALADANRPARSARSAAAARSVARDASATAASLRGQARLRAALPRQRPLARRERLARARAPPPPARHRAPPAGRRARRSLRSVARPAR